VKFDYVIIGGGSTRSDEDLIEVIRDNADTMYHVWELAEWALMKLRSSTQSCM